MLAKTMKSLSTTADHFFSRRTFLSSGTIAAGSLFLPPLARAWAQETAEDIAPFNRFPRMMQEYLVRRMQEAQSERLQRLASLQKKGDAEAYVAEVREKIQQSFGPFPEKTPLNARTTRVIERDTYHIENIIFESRPGFLVTANLYLPKENGDRRYPLPGVVGTCGHSSNGKAAELYQSFAQGLARQGYVVLIYDPIGQGERLQYPDETLKSRIGVGVREHLYAGNQQFLVGEFFGAWRAWDGVRALDYLLTRPEVDAKHLGVTGNSGGGTMTTWLCGVDQRYTMAAPSCFVTSFRRNLENELSADTEQCPPQAIALGLDHEDFLAALAPKPVIILAKERDYFDVRGSEAAYARLRRLYQLFNAEDNIALFTGPTGHGFSQENREAMYQWFHRATGMTRDHAEPEIKLEDDETLFCTPHGQVAELESRPIFQFTAETAAKLETERTPLAGPDLASAIHEVLELQVPEAVPDYRILRTRSSRQYPSPHFTNYAVETEPGVHALVTLLGEERHQSRPARGRERAILYVPHLSSDAELREDTFLAELHQSEPQSAFYACDVRGCGESQPDTGGANSFLQPYGSDYFYAIHSLMFDDPYPGQRVRDLLRVIAWLRSHGHREIHLVAKGRGTVHGAIAAFLAEDVVQVTLQEALPSFQEIAQSETYDWPLSTFIPNILKRFDLTDIYAELEKHKGLKMSPS